MLANGKVRARTPEDARDSSVPDPEPIEIGALGNGLSQPGLLSQFLKQERQMILCLDCQDLFAIDLIGKVDAADLTVGVSNDN